MADKNISIPAQGLTFEIEDATTADTWYKIGGLLTINNNEAAPTINDETTLDSTYKEKSVGIPDAGQFSGTMQYNRADPGQSEMHAAKAISALRNYRQVLSNGDTEEFSGFVLNMPYSANVGQRVEGNFSVEITGEPDWS